MKIEIGRASRLAIIYALAMGAAAEGAHRKSKSEHKKLVMDCNYPPICRSSLHDASERARARVRKSKPRSYPYKEAARSWPR